MIHPDAALLRHNIQCSGSPFPLSSHTEVSPSLPPPHPSTPGDDGAVQPPERGGVGEAEAAGAGATAVPGEPVAAGRAGQHAAEAAEERAECGPAGGGEEAPGVHEPAQEVRRGRVAHGESFRFADRLPPRGGES